MHAYVAAPGGRTAYLAELKSGSEVLVADAKGRRRVAIVGRVKVERRPLVIDNSPAKGLYLQGEGSLAAFTSSLFLGARKACSNNIEWPLHAT